jgi:hypothetical protein
MPDSIGENAIWGTFARALGAEPREHRVLKGASGVDHTLQALAVDEQRNRIIAVSAEVNPRIAAMVQVDLQTALPGTRVLVARPIIFDMPALARRLAQELGLTELRLGEISQQIEEAKAAGIEIQPPEILGGILISVLTAFGKVTIPPLNQIIALIQELATFDWQSIFDKAKDDAKQLTIPLTHHSHN